ncbi:MAG: ribonuclease HII [Myxococcota bacterium]
MNEPNWYIAGLDEAGRGPLAGPVVAAAVILNPKRRISGLSDSKKLNEKQREALIEPIFERSLGVGIGIVSAETIDQINILQASLLAMKLAVQDLKIPVHEVWVDGNQRVKFEIDIVQKTFVGGDDLHRCIMAASIVAKVHRDRLMLAYAEQFPVYGFERHKGYGTEMHLSALAQFGPCAIHRNSFAPVRNLTVLS